ncbi:MAG: hypothetical protein GYB51_21310, partial [Rhodobacteraceae bacterium]|nr:hypothetical protein [Paracoccaceae bacterium]
EETRPRNIAMIYAIKAFHAHADLTGKLIDPATVAETTQLKLDAQAALAEAQDAQAASAGSAEAAAEAQEAAELVAGTVSRATSVAGLTDPVTLSDGERGLVSGSGSSSIDGIYEVQSSAWLKIGELSNAGKVSFSDGFTRDDSRVPAEYDADGVLLREYDLEGNVRYSGKIYGADGEAAVLPDGVEFISAGDPGHVAEDGVMPLAFDARGRAILALHPESVRQAYVEVPPSVDTSALVSRRDIAIWSDSMAAAGSGWGPDHFAPLFSDRSVTTFGYGGRTAQSIGRYQGSFAVTVEAVTIPASGGVTVVPDGSWINDGQSTSATLSEVSGVVSRSGSTHTFTRDEAGDEVIVAAGTRLYIKTGDAYRQHTCVFVSGRNNINYTDGDDFALQGVVDVNISMVEHLTPLSKHFVFCGVTSKADERSDGTASEQEELRKVNRFNELMRRAVGEAHYVDLQDYMVNRALFEAINDGLLDSGTYPTAQDVLDIASGTVPVTLRSDATHYSDTGKTMAAKHVHRHILAKGY